MKKGLPCWYIAIHNNVQVHQESGERRAYPVEPMKYSRGRITVNIPMVQQRYCEISDNSSNSPLSIKKRRRGAIHTEVEDSMDDLCGGTKQNANNVAVYVIYFVGAVYLTDGQRQVLANDHEKLGLTMEGRETLRR